MGRIRIKKKEDVLPFRQTMAYRLMMLTLSILFFVYLMYEMVMAWSVNNTLAFLMAGVPACVAAFTIFYNLDHLKTAKIPARTMKRINRR